MKGVGQSGRVISTPHKAACYFGEGDDSGEEADSRRTGSWSTSIAAEQNVDLTCERPDGCGCGGWKDGMAVAAVAAAAAGSASV